MALYDNREVYKGMTEEEISSELQLDAIESKVKKLEAVTTDIELDTLRLEDQVFDAKIKSKYQELKATYGEELSQVEFMLETKYCYSKAKDYLNIFGSYNTLTVAKTLINDSEYKKVFDESSKKLLGYLKEKYKMYDNTMPIEYLSEETLSTQAEAIREVKKLMGLTPKAKLDFIPLDIIVELIMEDFPL